MAKLRQRRKPRRKIRWLRLLFVILLPLAVLVGLAAWWGYDRLPRAEPVVVVDKFQNIPVAQNQTNILLVGVSDSNSGMVNQAEAIVVAGLNFDDNSCRLLAIPRDTAISSKEKISQAYTLGGISLLKESAEHFLQIPLHHYLAMDAATFAKIIDLLGGVDLYVENNMRYQDPYANLEIDLKQGYQSLNGKEAAGYVRYCGDELGEVGRMQRQQKFLKTFFAHKLALLKLENLANLPQLKEIVKTGVQTNVTPTEALKLANTLRSLEESSFKAEMLPGRLVVAGNTVYWESDREEAKRLIAAFFYQE
ncbi:MAG: LCP family protein [Sporomusaceae bacterium]|jgi:LCP family protein required for cell wall assembly|nr:LCP family protein [Sporomusaceae bacterium]